MTNGQITNCCFDCHDLLLKYFFFFYNLKLIITLYFGNLRDENIWKMSVKYLFFLRCPNTSHEYWSKSLRHDL